MFNVNFAFLAWKEKRIFSRSPNISKHNGVDGPNHNNHISYDKIFKDKKMQNSWHMIWFSSRIPENHSMINASSRVAKSYNLHTLIFPRLSKHRRWRERGVGLGTTLYAWQWKLASLPLIIIWVMAVLHQEECLICSSSTKSPSHQSRRNSKLADKCRLVLRPSWGGGGGGGLLGLLHRYCELGGQIER